MEFHYSRVVGDCASAATFTSRMRLLKMSERLLCLSDAGTCTALRALMRNAAGDVRKVRTTRCVLPCYFLVPASTVAKGLAQRDTDRVRTGLTYRNGPKVGRHADAKLAKYMYLRRESHERDHS